MKYCIALLVLAVVCATGNAACCRCRASQDDIAVTQNGLSVSVTVDPNRGNCGPKINSFEGEIFWGEPWERSTKTKQAKPAKYTKTFKYDFPGCYELFVMYGADDSYCGVYKSKTIEVKMPSGKCFCGTEQKPLKTTVKGRTVELTVTPTYGSCPSFLRGFVSDINWGDGSPSEKKSFKEVKTFTATKTYANKGTYTIHSMYGHSHESCGNYVKTTVTIA